MRSRGRIIDRQGYVTINGEYEHRLVAERVLDRPLQHGEDVHHLNGDRADNRPENLAVTTKAMHAAHHHAVRRLELCRQRGIPLHHTDLAMATPPEPITVIAERLQKARRVAV
jgi:hypothetical protein